MSDNILVSPLTIRVSLDHVVFWTWPGHGLDPKLDNIWYCITNIVSGESGEDSLKYVGKDGG